MSRDVKTYKLLENAAPRAIASSTNATPIVVTTAAPHGYETGQKITVNGHLVNTNANGTWVVTVTGASTFELDDSVGNGVGGATGVYMEQSKYAFAADHRNVVLSFDTDGGGDAAMTIKCVGSIQKTPPDFAAPQSADNQYDFLEMIDLQDGTPVDGDVGFVVAAADDHRQFEANINGQEWIAVIATAGTAGEVTVNARLFNNTR
jgi:hypothetical protein